MHDLLNSIYFPILSLFIVGLAYYFLHSLCSAIACIFHKGYEKSIFIIGPEGVGKTVFIAAFSNHLEKHPKLVFDAKNIASSNYVTRALSSLSLEKWPSSNPQGKLETLTWEFGTNRRVHQLFLYDYSGQDMRSVLIENSIDELNGKPRELREKIDQSDLLIYLLDLEGLVGGGSTLESNQNSWLLKTFLNKPEWSDKKKLIIITKADLYHDMIQEEGGDVKKIILRHKPSGTSNRVISRLLNNIDILQISSLETKTIMKDNRPVRVPKNPIQSKGFDQLIKIILKKL